MPPRRGRAPVHSRNIETQRLPGDAALPSPAAASACRPHHLVSRLHPPWGSSAHGIPLRMSGVASNITTTANKDEPSGSASVAPAAARNRVLSSETNGTASTYSGRGCAGLSTRVSGSARRKVGSASTAAPSRRTSGRLPPTAHKRPRSTSTTSFAPPAEAAKIADSPDDAEDSNDNGVDAVHNGSDDEQHAETEPCTREMPPTIPQVSSSSSPSLSLAPMVTERKVLQGGDSGGGDVERRNRATACEAIASGEAASHAPECKSHRLQVQVASPSANALATVEEVVVSPVRFSDTVPPPKPLQHDTTTSTAESRVLFDEDEEGEEEGRQPWHSNHLSEANVDLQQLARAQEVKHVLGELSESPFITSARQHASLHSLNESGDRDNRTQHTKCAPTDTDKEVQGEPLDINHTEPAATGTNVVLGDEDNESAMRRTCITCTTPSLKSVCADSDQGSGTPVLEGSAWGAASAAVTLTETLAVQDLSLLPDESGGDATVDVGGAVNSDGCVYTPPLSLYTSQHTPYPAIASVGASARLRVDTPEMATAEEVLLGEGVISPPVKRITATPRQAAHNVEVAVEDDTETRSGAGEIEPGPAGVHGKALATGVSNSWTTFLSSPSFATPCVATRGGETSGSEEKVNTHPTHLSSDDTASMTQEQPVPLRVSQTPSSPSLPLSSLPSTLDDGLWKEGANTLQVDVVDSHAMATGHCALNRQTVIGDTPAPQALSVSVAQQESVPVDPFLSTPPQFKGGCSVTEKNASGSDERVLRSPQRSGFDDARNGGYSPAASDVPTRTLPRSARKSSMGLKSAITGATVDVQVFRVGTRVEGRWGRQWFPAVISEAPRNGFVQIEWEDGSRLHLRLREVRLVPGTATVKRAGTVSVIRDANPSAASAGEATSTEGDHAVLTATQLVTLMEEEDAQDGQQRPEPLRIRPSASHSETAPPMMTSIDAQVNRRGGDGDEGAKEDATMPPLGAGNACGTAGCRVDAINTDGDAHADGGGTAATSASAANSRSPSRSPVPTHAAVGVPPCEVHPSSLCIFLPQNVRRDLLQGEGSPPASAFSSLRDHVGPATELQRRTELQRILHFLTSAGAAVIDSVAQADNMAAQLGDSDDVKGTPSLSPLSSLTALQPYNADPSPMRETKAPKAVAGSSGRRKTTTRVSLTRRSMTSAITVASCAQRLVPKHFIFLVSSTTARVCDNAEPPEKLDQKQDVLPEVCLAHALGVSAIHASWLWSIAPGTSRVKLPTPADQVELSPSAVPGTWGMWKATGTGPPSNKSVALPLRFTPLAVKDRWLSTKDVVFVARDDRMEMWLNAAGATVTAELGPTPPCHVACQSFLQGNRRLSASVEGALVGRNLGSALPRCQSEPPSCSVTLKQLRAERTPDFVYVPDGVAVPPNVDHLGCVPVLKVSWVADGIEQHYHRCCNPTSSAEPVLPTPPTLAFLRTAILPTKPLKENHTRRFNTPSHPGHVQYSPPSSLKPAGNDEEERNSPEGLHNSKATTVPILGNERDCMRQHGVDTVDPDSVLPLPQHRDKSVDGAAPSSCPPGANRGSMDEGADDTACMLRGSINGEAEALTLRIGGDDAQKPLQRETEDFVSAGGSGGVAPASVNTEAEEDIMSRSPDGTGATAAVLPDAVTFTKPLACTSHPAIAIGEDYYFTLPSPQSSPPPSLLLHGLSHPHAPPSVLPSTTIMLGQVVDLQADASPSPLLRQHLSADDVASSLPFSQPQCGCRVTLQLYDPKYISMHVDPRSGEVVHQTTVYLAQRWATVSGTSLLYNTPVYVIAMTARPHVYFLEEAEGEVTTPCMSDSAYHSRLRQLPILRDAPTPPASDFSHAVARATADGTLSPDFHDRRALPGAATTFSPVPTRLTSRGCLRKPPTPFLFTQSAANRAPSPGCSCSAEDVCGSGAG
ncbi:hypothetical protein, conserved [Leishmania tarentolae]|uniref:Uncharacterized protein n=1 Tax=Leishmania tarentolae TaxID=5689 RepID=A0A640KT72_LEITA|nr:hypothetical protein, conserved [Leishmania tarentolae]